MRAFDLTLEDGPDPLYLRIADSLRRSLKRQEIAQGTLLPSTRELAKQLNIHRHTVTRGLEELVAEGWLASEPGRGYRAVAAGHTEFEASPTDWPAFSVLEQLGQSDDELFAFPSGKPDLRLFPRSEFFRELRHTLREVPPEVLLGYSDPLGCAAFRSELKAYLSRMRGLTEGEVVVTHGSQEAIFLLGQLLAKGERRTICVESLGYPPAWDALRLSGAELVGIPVDQDGLRVELFEEIARRKPPALVYLTPLHQYPTTVSLSLERRRRLLSLCAEFQIPVIEDDYDHEFHYRGKPTLPLAADDRSGLVVYVSTFSKLVYPSCRIGFCLVSPELLRPLSRLKRSVTRQNDLLLQFTMARWMRAGGLDRHLRKMRKVYCERLQLMVTRLREIGLEPTVPQGGMSVWVRVGPRCERALKRCATKGLRLRSSLYFELERDDRAREYLRLGFASSSAEEIEKGITLLGEALGAE